MNENFKNGPFCLDFFYSVDLLLLKFRSLQNWWRSFQTKFKQKNLPNKKGCTRLHLLRRLDHELLFWQGPKISSNQCSELPCTFFLKVDANKNTSMIIIFIVLVLNFTFTNILRLTVFWWWRHTTSFLGFFNGLSSSTLHATKERSASSWTESG